MCMDRAFGKWDDSGPMTDYVTLFTCPNRHLKTPISPNTIKSMTELEFPITVERCPACGETHVLNRGDVKLSGVPGT